MKEIFIQKCSGCHNHQTENAGINIMNHPLLLKTRPVVVPGRPEASELFSLITSKDKDRRMPLDKESLNDGEIDTVRRWIEAGAPPFPRTHKKK